MHYFTKNKNSSLKRKEKNLGDRFPLEVRPAFLLCWNKNDFL